MQRSISTITATLVAILLSSTMSLAQDAGPGMPANPAFKDRPPTMSPALNPNAQRPHRKPGMIKQSLMQKLNLDEATAEKLAGEMEILMTKRRDNRTTTRQYIEKLKIEMKAEPINKKAVKKLLDKIETSNNAVIRLRQEEIKIFKKYLSIEQQARMIIMQNERIQQKRMRPMMHPGSGRFSSQPSMRGGAPRPDATQPPAK